MPSDKLTLAIKVQKTCRLTVEANVRLINRVFNNFVTLYSYFFII